MMSESLPVLYVGVKTRREMECLLLERIPDRVRKGMLTSGGSVSNITLNRLYN